MDCRDGPAERSPPPLVLCQRHHLLAIRNQMRTKNRAHTRRIAGSLELDCPVHAVGVGAGECPEAILRRGLGQRFGTGCTETEGEMRVGV